MDFAPDPEQQAVADVVTSVLDRDNSWEALVSGGVSNVSFSFRGNNPVREAIHAVFLYHAIKAGMDMGIVNAGQLAIYEELDPELCARIEDVILNRRDDATERLLEIAERFRGEAGGGRRKTSGAPRLRASASSMRSSKASTSSSRPTPRSCAGRSPRPAAARSR